MAVENIMYFVLGLLVAGLLALIIVPAIWRRAVRLTRKRIQAAMPMTMAEFRADKDQLRAEFALTTRRLEMTVEALRQRLANQIGAIDQHKVDLKAMQTEREQHRAIVGEFEAREAALRHSLADAEKHNADLAQRLRMRERDLAARQAELANTREALRGRLPQGTDIDGARLSGDYKDDVDALLGALAIERQRGDFLEAQAHTMIARLELNGRRSAGTNAAIAEMRAALAKKPGDADDADVALRVAEERIAGAERRLAALLEDTRDAGGAGSAPSLAEQLSQEDALEQLRQTVLGVETTIMDLAGNGGVPAAALRENFADIAARVSRIVYAADSTPPEVEESLFDRVQRFAEDGAATEKLPPPSRTGAAKSGPLVERMAALANTQHHR